MPEPLSGGGGIITPTPDEESEMRAVEQLGKGQTSSGKPNWSLNPHMQVQLLATERGREEARRKGKREERC